MKHHSNKKWFIVQNRQARHDCENYKDKQWASFITEKISIRYTKRKETAKMMSIAPRSTKHPGLKKTYIGTLTISRRNSIWPTIVSNWVSWSECWNVTLHFTFFWVGFCQANLEAYIHLHIQRKVEWNESYYAKRQRSPMVSCLPLPPLSKLHWCSKLPDLLPLTRPHPPDLEPCVSSCHLFSHPQWGTSAR